MSNEPYKTNPAPNAWKLFTDAEHTIRASYLAIVDLAAKEHLNGPYPDRDAYTRIEHQAWAVYYQAGRANWRQYTRNMEAEINPAPHRGPPPLPDWAAGTGWPPSTRPGGLDKYRPATGGEI